MAIYRDVEVLFVNLTQPNNFSDKYEVTCLVDMDSPTYQELKEVCRQVPDKDGPNVARFTAKSKTPIAVWSSDGQKLTADDIKRGDRVGLSGRLAGWEYRGRKGKSVWIDAILLVEHGNPSGVNHDDNYNPFQSDYPF